VGTERVICDTNVLISLFDRTGPERQQTLRHVAKIGKDRIVIPAVAEMELINGVRDKEHGQRVAKNIREFKTLPLGEGIGERAIALLWKYRLSHGLDIPDALITAIETDLPLFTHNTKDFRFIDGLELYIP